MVSNVPPPEAEDKKEKRPRYVFVSTLEPSDYSGGITEKVTVEGTEFRFIFTDRERSRQRMAKALFWLAKDHDSPFEYLNAGQMRRKIVEEGGWGAQFF